jgi:hypothetical protein
MDKYLKMIQEHNMHVADMEKMAQNTLNVLMSGRNVNRDIVEYIVKIFYKTERGVFKKIRTRDNELVKLRRLYLFIRYLYFDINIQDVADEFSHTRSTIYYHCQVILDSYDSDVEFRHDLSTLFLPETIEIMRDKLNRKRRGR